MSKGSERVIRWRDQTKQRIVDSFGGKCGICGYNKCNHALEFHHLDPTQKEFTISRKTISWKKIVDELRKGVLICSNCHKEVGAGFVDVPDDIQRFDEKYVTYQKEERIELCPICKTNKKNILAKTCSKACAARKRGKVNWDSINLLELRKTMTLGQIGNIFGVTETAVWKRLKKIA